MAAGRSDSQPLPSYVPKHQRSPGEGGTIGGYDTNSTRIVRGCEVWLKAGHARAPCLSVPALWQHQTASDFTALRSPGELGGSPAVFSSSIPCAPREGDCRDWKRVGCSAGEGGGAISLFL